MKATMLHSTMLYDVVATSCRCLNETSLMMEILEVALLATVNSRYSGHPGNLHLVSVTVTVRCSSVRI